MRLPIALLGVLILAGCAGDDAATPQGVPAETSHSPASGGESGAASPTDAAPVPPPEEVTDSGPKALHFEQTFQLTITHVFTPYNGERVNQEPNCVGFGKDQVWLILNGKAEATWASNGPFASKMTVDLRDVGPLATNNGSASPSVLEFGRFQTVPNALLGLWVIVQPTDQGVVLQQPVSLTVSFDYLGVPDVKTVVEPCVYKTQFEEEDSWEVQA